jgi:hypothetical protein
MVSMVLIPFSARAEGATIWTDKDNYGPSDTVTIFGSGFLPNAQVTITITAPDSSVATIYAWTDEFGNFTAQYVLDGQEGTYTVTATDGTNTATTTFTEALGITVSYNAATYTMTVTINDMDKGKNYYLKYYSPLGLRATHGPFYMSGTGKWDTTDTLILEPTDQGGKDAWKVELYEEETLKKTVDKIDVLETVWTTDSTYAAVKTIFMQGETVYVKGIGYDPKHGKGDEEGYWYLKFFYGTTLKYTSPWIKATSTWDITYSYTLPSDAPTGTWTINVYCAEHNALHGSTTFTVTQYVPPTATVTFSQVGVGSDFTGVVLTVDGKDYGAAAVAAGVAITKNVGESISFTYHSPLPVDTGKQYVWTSTEGLSSAQSGTITVSDGGGSVTAYYKTQYYLAVYSDYGTPSGAGWYDECTYAYAGLDTGIVEEDGTRHLFVKWAGDATGTNYAQSEAIHMDGPKIAIAEWKTQYYLTVVSPYDTPGGMGWYDAGATAYATLASGIVDLAPRKRAVFTGWTGDASGIGLTSNAITMNGPKTAIALWVIQWYLDVDVAPPEAGTVPGEGWYNNCTTVTLTAPEYLPNATGVGGVRYKFSYWDVDRTPVDGNPINVHMDAPHVATAHYTPQYYLTVKTDPAGLVEIPGSGWYNSCTEVTLTAPLEPVVNYLFAYWTVDTTPEPFLENVITVHMDGPKTATAVYKDYLGHARVEIEALKTYLNDLRAAGKIGKHEYDYFMKALNAIEKDIARGMKQLDRERRGFDDRQKGFEDLRHAVMKIKRLIHQVENWAKKGKIPSADATWIISELETIRMKLVNKSWAEALAEKALALKAIADAKLLGKDTTKAEAELIKVDRELAKAIQCINEGKYSQAIQHFKHAFTHSQHAVKKAYDPTWDIDYKDWIDELEEEEP